MRKVYSEPGYTEGDLDALLLSRRFVYVSCYAVTPKYGDVIRCSSAQRDIRVHTLEDSPQPVTFPTGPLRLSGLSAKASIGLDVDDQKLAADFLPDTELFGMKVGNALKWGLLDGAMIETNRYYAADWGSPWVGGLKIFRGRVSSIDSVSASSADINVKSALILLDTKVPRNFYQSSCGHAFGDPGCGVDRTSLAAEGIVGVGSTSGVVLWPGTIDRHVTGTLLIDNPEGVTFVRSVLVATPGTSLSLSYPLPFTPAPGTSFTVLPGCRRTHEDCEFYDNTDRYFGFRFIPVAETAV